MSSEEHAGHLTRTLGEEVVGLAGVAASGVGAS
jgi:hypothetical protein